MNIKVGINLKLHLVNSFFNCIEKISSTGIKGLSCNVLISSDKIAAERQYGRIFIANKSNLSLKLYFYISPNNFHYELITGFVPFTVEDI